MGYFYYLESDTIKRMQKISIIGPAASGKTTLANKLSKLLKIQVYHLDQIGWKDNRVFAPQDEIIEKVKEILKKDSWIIDGSMHRSKTLEMRMESSDMIILYDLPLLVCLWRQTKRYFKYYNKVRPDMGGNNKQKCPFTWKDIKFALNNPMDDVYSKLKLHLKNKNIIIIKNIKDEKKFIKSLIYLYF